MQNKEFRTQNVVSVPAMVLSSAFCILFSVFCFGKAPAVKEPVFEIDKAYQKGPLTAHIRVDKSKITIAQTLLVDVETAIGAGYDVNVPEIGSALKDFGVLGKQNLGSRLDVNNNVVSTYRYRLEPFLPGKFAIPAFTFEFHDANEQTKKTYELTTEPIEIEVASLFGQQRGKVTMADIEGVVGMRGKLILWWLLPAAAAIAGAGGIWWYLRKQKTKAAIRIFKLAHEVAYARLQALINRDLLGQGRVKEFYEGVSDILRHYIEDRFELRAPERTTEEFLAEIRDAGVLTDADRKALVEFLTHCDLVKFAKHSPTDEQIQRTIDLAKNFIEQTKSDERKIDVTDRVEGSVAVPATAKHLAGGV
ncbi:MAG: BatD family protein [Sedimentisphaerales bacterium]